MFPRGIPSAALPVAVTSALRPVQLPRQPHVRLAVTRILRPPHPARPAGRRNPPPRFRSPSPPPGPPPTALPKKLRTPACGIVLRASHHASGLPGTPVATLWELRFGCVARVVRIGGSRGHLRALRRQALSSSLPALPHSCRRLCSLAVPAGTLDPAPCGGKEHLSVLRLQNPGVHRLCKTSATERGSRSNPRVPGEVGWASMVRAVICWRRAFMASIRHPHSTPAIPRPWPQRRGVSQNSSPRTARPHPRSTEASGLPLEALLFKRAHSP